MWIQVVAMLIYPEHSSEIGDIRIMADHRMYRDKKLKIRKKVK